jgi:hypothetical protein
MSTLFTYPKVTTQFAQIPPIISLIVGSDHPSYYARRRRPHIYITCVQPLSVYTPPNFTPSATCLCYTAAWSVYVPLLQLKGHFQSPSIFVVRTQSIYGNAELPSSGPRRSYGCSYRSVSGESSQWTSMFAYVLSTRQRASNTHTGRCGGTPNAPA